MSKLISVDKVKELPFQWQQLLGKYFNIKSVPMEFVDEAFALIEALASEPGHECQRCKELEALLEKKKTTYNIEHPFGGKPLKQGDILPNNQAIGKGEGSE